MQESAHLIVRKERRFLRSRPSKVHHIHNMRTMIFLANHILRLEVVHPCAAAFTIPRVEVRIINGQELTLLVKHLICRHFRVIYLDILILLEGDTIQTLRQTEHTLLHVLQLEIRTKVIIRDRIFLLFEFLAIIAEVPRLQMCGIETVLMRKIFQFLHFLTSGRHIRVAELV